MNPQLDQAYQEVHKFINPSFFNYNMNSVFSLIFKICIFVIMFLFLLHFFENKIINEKNYLKIKNIVSLGTIFTIIFIIICSFGIREYNQHIYNKSYSYLSEMKVNNKIHYKQLLPEPRNSSNNALILSNIAPLNLIQNNFNLETNIYNNNYYLNKNKNLSQKQKDYLNNKNKEYQKDINNNKVYKNKLSYIDRQYNIYNAIDNFDNDSPSLKYMINKWNKEKPLINKSYQDKLAKTLNEIK